jgi:hypothetical protein
LHPSHGTAPRQVLLVVVQYFPEHHRPGSHCLHRPRSAVSVSFSSDSPFAGTEIA